MAPKGVIFYYVSKVRTVVIFSRQNGGNLMVCARLLENTEKFGGINRGGIINNFQLEKKNAIHLIQLYKRVAFQTIFII